MAGISIVNHTRRLVAPRALFGKVARRVLPHHDISLVFVGQKKAQDLNKKLRGKTYVPNVLSYALGKDSGEIIICPAVADIQAPEYGMSRKNFVLYLFIHGLLHLKGWAHGGTMERWERLLLAKFGEKVTHHSLNETTHRHRNRHRHIPGKNGRGRRARR